MNIRDISIKTAETFAILFAMIIRSNSGLKSGQNEKVILTDSMSACVLLRNTNEQWYRPTVSVKEET